MKNIPECSTSLFDPGPLGHFFNSVAIVAIIRKLVVLRIVQLFCYDRNDRNDHSDHMETSIKLEYVPCEIFVGLL